MNLTEKCKEEFEKWFSKTYSYHGNQSTPPLEKVPYDDIGFYNYNSSMQYGVYVDFFDSLGIYIQISLYDIDCGNWQGYIESEHYDFRETHYVSREETRTSVIEKANEIYNSKQ